MSMKGCLMMKRLIIEGGARLRGELPIQGAKNSALPILAATLIYGGETVLKNCPDLSDVDAAIKILEYIGCIVKREKDTLIINSDNIRSSEIPQELMHEMRSSIVFLGAIVSRMGKAKMSFPGGCELGPRPIDLHISSLKNLGVTITETYGTLNCSVDNNLKGTKICLSFPSVGATENIILASVMAEGETIITNAAQEPEIVDLANYLISRGANIDGAGKSTVVIKGVKKLHDTKYEVMSDRIVAATYLCGAAITGGDVTITKINTDDIDSILPILEQAGCKLDVYSDSVHIIGPSIIRPVKNIRTMPYPGFPTDAQAPIMSLLCMASGTSMFVENIFENRYKHTGELIRMGADIKIEGKVAVVDGVKKLYGTKVESTDLRGGAAVCIAALVADGITTVSEIHHIDRGYEAIEVALTKLGGKIKRE